MSERQLLEETSAEVLEALVEHLEEQARQRKQEELQAKLRGRQ